MDGTLIIAILIIIIALCIYVTSRRLPAEGMRPMTYGDIGGVASQKVYYPRWASALRKSNQAPDEKTVIRKCSQDPKCVAVAYTTDQQGAGRTAHFWPYTLDPTTNTMYYHPTDAESGPDLYVKRNVEMISSYPSYERPATRQASKLIDPRDNSRAFAGTRKARKKMM
jgi:hypothetical protein